MAVSVSNLTEPPDPSHFVAQQRSLYVPAGDVGYWQGAIREGDTDRGDAAALRRAIDSGRPHHAVPAVRRPGRRPRHDHPLLAQPDENGDWLFGIGRHWTL